MDEKYRNSGSCYLTEGSKKADKPVSPLAKAKRKETMAAAINIFTSKSSNCFRTSRQKGVPAISIITRNVRNHFLMQVLINSYVIQIYLFKPLQTLMVLDTNF